jgi:hypothetical protein
MASTHKSLRSGTANKRPTTSIADGQIALNTNAASPGLYFKDSTGASIIKIGPVHVGTTAPNVAPAGSSGNSNGETWLDTSLTPNGWKVWTGAAWVNATPAGSATVQGLLELATDAETQAGSDTARAVTPAGLQSKVSDSTSTISSTTIASSTAVKSAYDLANAALPKSGGTVTGNLEIGTSGSLTFEGATADAFETTIAVVDPTADRTITFPDTTGTVVTTGDTGTVTSAMIANSTIVDADISASAEIAVSKLADGAARQLLQTDAAGTGVEWTTNVDVPGTLDVTGTTTLDSTLSVPLGSAAAPTVFFTGDSNTGIYSPGADQLAISTNGTGRLFIDSSGRVLVGTSTSRTVGDIAHNIQLEGASGNTGISIVNNYSTLADPSAYITLARSRSSTVGGSGLVSSGDYLGLLDFTGNDGSSFKVAARIGAFVDGTPGTNDMPGRLVFSTTSDNAGSPTERMRLDSSGRLGLGTSSPGAKLHVAAGANVALQLDADTGLNTSIALSENGSIKWYFGNLGADDSFRFYDNTAATERLRITSAGLVGIGTSAPTALLSLVGSNTTNSQNISFLATDASNTTFRIGHTTGSNCNIGPNTNHNLRLGAFTDSAGQATAFTPYLTLDTSGRVGIGTTSPNQPLHVAGNILGTGAAISLESSVAAPYISVAKNGVTTSYLITDNSGTNLQVDGASSIRFTNNSTERARIDSSGRLLVGTSTDQGTATLQIQGDSASATNWGKVFLRRGQAIGTIGGNVGSRLGQLDFGNQDGAVGATIMADSDATWGSGDYPTRLVFSTTADGAASPTERMRITQAGNLRIGQSTTDTPGVSGNSTVGTAIGATGYVAVSRDSQVALYVNRKTNDGELVYFSQDGEVEGTISVSGTTVSYNGGHLSRWSQLPGGAEREEILRGTVLSNIDEMCSWGEEDNEQLNRMKVSDVEGDKNVSGVFQAWDDDDDTYTDDFYCAMTGDFIIRIAASVTVQRGDLLMSAGDGTAKPQDDDIIRSKTVAKVTSTHVTCTYEDGSYCVPCVLMAC